MIRSTAATGSVIPDTDIIATVTTDSTDTNPANNTLSQNTTIDDGADLTTTLIGAPNPAIAGGDVTYSAVVSNNGPNTAVNIQVVFQLSVNMTYVSGSASGTNWSCAYDGGSRQLTCSGTGAGADLASGDSANQITFIGKVTGAQTGTLTTTATVSSDTGDPVPNNDVVTADVAVNTGTDIAVTISPSASSVIGGSAIAMTLEPRNLGPFDADDVQVDYTVPAGFTIDGTPTGPGWTCNVASQAIQCTRPVYTIGATDDITVNLTSPAVAAPTDYVHSVAIDTTTAEAVERQANNTDSTTITVAPDGVDLSISKTKGPNPVAQNRNINNTIVVHNDGPQDAAAGTVTVQDQLSAGETFVSSSGNWTCIDNSPNIDCTYNALISSGANSTALTITTRADGTGPLSNTAVVDYTGGPPGDYDNTNNSVTASVTSTDAGTASADLVVTKTFDADNSDGDTTTLGINESAIVYTIEIRNAGPSDVTGITLTDVIPGYVNGSSGTTGVSITSNASGYNCTTGSTVSCTQTGTLSNGATDTIGITVTRPLFDGVRTNTAAAFSSVNGDLDRGNNRDSVNVTIEAVADITVQSKTVTPNPVRSGVEATYTVSIKNNGPSTAQNVALVDTFSLPPDDAGFTFISANASGGGSCSGLTANQSYVSTDNPVLTCNWANIANEGAQTLTLRIRPNYMSGSPAGRTFANSVAATTTTHESDGGNNSFGPVTLTVNADAIDLLINNSDTPDPVAWDPANGGDNANNDVVYDVEFTNRGPSYATGVNFVYTYTPKAGKTVRFDCDEAGAGDACGTSPNTCIPTGGVNPVTGPDTLELTCSATTVAGETDEMTAGSTGHRYLHFRILTQPDSTGDTHNTNATISANELESILANNSEAESTSARSRVDMEITSKTPAPGSVQLDQPFLWTINVTNNGPLDSDQTDVTDTLPPGMVFHGPVPSWVNTTDSTGGACNTTGGDLNCDLSSMSVGAIAVITVPVLIDTFTLASVDNCATATTNGVDVVPANNTNVCGTVTVTNSYYPSDYGDAPDTTGATGPGDYATIRDNGGPRHMLPGVTWLGGYVDSDGPGAQQNSSATADDANAGNLEAGSCTGNDDEDGITLPAALIAGQNATIGIEVSGTDCALDGWIDYNADGDFDDAGERIFNAYALAAGVHSETIVIPAIVTLGNSYARFRCSSAGGLTPVEDATNGEIEDYLVSLQPDSGASTTPTDYGDLPDTGPGTGIDNYQTLPTDNGPSHVLGVANAPYLGACVDSDVDTHQNIDATADDSDGPGGSTPPLTVGTCANGDEDGVVFTAPLQLGLATSIDVTSSTGTDACVLNAWIDFNADGDFLDANERIASDTIIASGTTTTLTPTIPAGAALGFTYARFRCNSSGGLGSIGAAVDGEVEDYRVAIRPYLATTSVDFGDAPDATAGEANADYSTQESNDGPSHVLGGAGSPYLGACVDSDDGTAQNAGADADDTAPAGGVVRTDGVCDTAGDDEDGVVFTGLLVRGKTAEIEITTAAAGACLINGWIDFNADGDFSDGDEQILFDQSQFADRTESYRIDVPRTAETGATYARFRCSSAGGLGPLGAAPDGEVEDYLVTTSSGAASIPTLQEWSLILMSLMLGLIAYAYHFRRRF